MADQVRVFVSHHHSPAEDSFTARLVRDLEAAGADVWVDTSGITSDDFVKKISEGMAGRKWLVLVMTPAAVASPWVQREVNVALSEQTAGRMLGVLPLVMQSCREQDIPLLWRPLHRYDATSDYIGAVSGLLRALGLATPANLGKQQPEPPIPNQPSIPAEHFPERLASLGYQAHILSGVEVILPPLCDVPEGEFIMGSDPVRDRNAQDEEKPHHRLSLPTFQIARFPVTVAEYACFVRRGYQIPAFTGSASSSDYYVTWESQVRRGLDHPVVNITWHDANAYVAWLVRLTSQRWRLPTEAEWEKAARWDEAAGIARIYPWGGSFDETIANTYEGKRGTTTSVGSYPTGASPYGALDMAGNVWEWTGTIYEPYTATTTERKTPVSNVTNDAHAIRGGSFRDLGFYARSACRHNAVPSGAIADRGFRLVIGTEYK
jgi:formylglycine-generating enzyme required for sulfatase activity